MTFKSVAMEMDELAPVRWEDRDRGDFILCELFSVRWQVNG